MLPRELEGLKNFHGHLGPYAVVGYRMGNLALKLLQARGKKLTATVKTGLKPPISCILDGIQFSTPCTLGKGNITVTQESIPSAVFKGEKSVEITLKAHIASEIEENGAREEDALKCWKKSDEELFDVSYF